MEEALLALCSAAGKNNGCSKCRVSITPRPDGDRGCSVRGHGHHEIQKLTVVFDDYNPLRISNDYSTELAVSPNLLTPGRFDEEPVHTGAGANAHRHVYCCVHTMLLLFVAVVGLFGLRSCKNRPLHAYSPGDITIGGLFPVHRKTNRSIRHGPLSCSAYDIRTFLHTQVMIYSIGEVNQQMARVLPNFSVGYDIYDTCGDVSFAIRATLQLLKNSSDDTEGCFVPEGYPSPLAEPKTKAVIGENYSEVSAAVARVLALLSVAQISYSSTSEQLSRKLKFPTFLRTISSDEHQTKAIAQLVKLFNWKTVAIIGSDDEYGKYGCDQIVEILVKMGDVCIEFVDILPGYFSQNSSKAHTKLAELLSNINASSAEVIIMFTKDANVDVIMNAVIKNNLNRTWIASDSWSTSTKVSTLPGIDKAGEVFGFISKRNEVPGFKDYVTSKFNGTTNAMLEHYLSHYPICSNQSEENMGGNCSQTNSQQDTVQCQDLNRLATFIDQDKSYNIYLAVQVIAKALRHLLKCDNSQCKNKGKVSTLGLLKEIQNVNVTVNNTHVYFDSNGDPSLGYDIVHWSMAESEQGAYIKKIGEYWPDGEMKIPNYIVISKSSVMVTVYNCSKTCKPGQELKQQRKRCCTDCVPCADEEFSAGNGKECHHCGPGKYSSPQRDTCLTRSVEFLQWSDPFAIILSCSNVFGIIVTTMFAVLFTIHHDTPIVRAVGGYLSFLELFSLLVCFCTAFSFIGVPTSASCMFGLPVFCIVFSLCISCILANLLQILVGFSFDPKIQSWIRKLNQPLLVVTVLPGIQLALCVPWLYLFPPFPNQTILGKNFLLQCNKGSNQFFIATLSYNAFLGLSCFLFAFKGKQLPDLYKNAVLITTSMTLFLIIWILFIPIYISLFGKHKQAIESASVIISSYSILGCHFAPKCYIMVFRKEINNESAITKYIRQHYEQKNIAVVKS